MPTDHETRRLIVLATIPQHCTMAAVPLYEDAPAQVRDPSRGIDAGEYAIIKQEVWRRNDLGGMWERVDSDEKGEYITFETLHEFMRSTNQELDQGCTIRSTCGVTSRADAEHLARLNFQLETATEAAARAVDQHFCRYIEARGAFVEDDVRHVEPMITLPVTETKIKPTLKRIYHPRGGFEDDNGAYDLCIMEVKTDAAIICPVAGMFGRMSRNAPFNDRVLMGLRVAMESYYTAHAAQENT